MSDSTVDLYSVQFWWVVALGDGENSDPADQGAGQVVGAWRP